MRVWLAASMLPIALLLMIWTPALVGLGWPLLTLARRASGGSIGGIATRAAIAGLLGIFVTTTPSSALGLVCAVRPGLSIALLAAGWTIVIVRYRALMRVPRRAWIWVVAWGVVVVVLDARGMPWYDTGLYHLQAVAWAGEGPLPRGLANLQDRLGFNCAWFPLAAVVEFPLASEQSCFVANGVLMLLAPLPALAALARVVRRLRADDVVFALSLFPLAEYAGRHGMVSSLAPDLIVMTLVPFAAAVWVRSPRNALLACVLATLAVTVKLSAAPLAFAAALAAIAGCRSIRRPWLALTVVAFCGIAMATWFARGIWLSGCPLFPSTLGRIGNLPWAVPPADARLAERAIGDWAKYHLDSIAVVPGTPWMGRWLRRVGLTEPVVVPVIILLAGIASLWVRRQSVTPRGQRAIVAAAGLLPAIAFWFAVAPDPRFGVGYLCTAAALVVAAAWDGHRGSIARFRAIGVALAVALVATVRPDHRLLHVAALRWPTIPTAKLVVRQAADGTPIWMPVGDDRVWAAPRPATPDLNPTLRCVRAASGRFREFDVSRARVGVLPADQGDRR